METNQMTKKILELQKGAFAGWYGVMTAMQDQVVTSMNTVLDQSDWMPDEGRRMVQSWVKACTKGRDDYKGLVEESIDGLAKVLVVKTKKPSGAKKPETKARAASAARPKEPVAATKQTASVESQKSAIEKKEEKPAAIISKPEKAAK